jgi:hypothetical protein
MSLTVSSTNAIDNLAAALIEAAHAVEGEATAEPALTAANGASAAAAPVHAEATVTLVQGGFVERILGDTHAAVAAAPAQVHSEHIDKGVETANLQMFARPHAPNPEPPRPSDAALPSDKHAHSEFAVPSALLIPTALLGLQVEHAATWPMSARGFDPDPAPLHEARIHDRHAPPAPFEEEPPEQQEEEATTDPVADEKSDTPCGVVFTDEDDGAWCEALTHALRRALAAKVPPHALLLAAEQWQRGRCVVLACPQGADPAGVAWAFVLWPRKQPVRRADGAPAALALFGLRIEARLQWSALPTGARWCQVRVIKQHHPRTGRQLLPSAADPSGRVACEVQLGPVLARPLRCCDVCVRINAVRRFWTALGTQWSMHVVVCSHALLDAVEENAR